MYLIEYVSALLDPSIFMDVKMVNAEVSGFILLVFIFTWKDFA